MRGVAYVRVSREDQAASGLGLEAQRHACRQWAEREGFEAAGPWEDAGVSGAAGLGDRPGMVAALADLRPGDVLVVAKRDRLGRDPLVIAVVEAAAARKGCRIASAAGEGTGDDDPASVMMRRIVDAFGEYERLVIQSRTRAALAAKRRRGERCGQVPYGSKVVDDGRRSKKGDLPCGLAPEPAEAEAEARIKTLRAEGWTLRAIARAMDEGPVRPKNGGPQWARSTIRRLSKKEKGKDDG